MRYSLTKQLKNYNVHTGSKTKKTGEIRKTSPVLYYITVLLDSFLPKHFYPLAFLSGIDGSIIHCLACYGR